MHDLKHYLEESHKDQYQWFLFHQESLLLGNDDFAQQSFSIFSLLLNTHIQFENEMMLSASNIQVNDLQWELTVYQKEHEKILKMLANLQSDLARFFLLKGREKRLALLDVFAKQQVFRNVMDHHEIREERDLFQHLHNTPLLIQQWQSINAPLLERYFDDKEKLKHYFANV